MRAIIQTQYGAPSVMQLEERPTPAPGPNQLLVRVFASGVSRGDLRVRAADYPGIGKLAGRLVTGLWAPRHEVVGSQFAGEVVAVGSAVTRYAPGDRIFGSNDFGALADFMVVSEDAAIAPLPDGLDYAQAAALPYAAITAIVFLDEQLRLQGGERICIVGATGGVGRFAVQLARHRGAQVVAVCSPEQADLARRLGAHAVIDYTQTDPLAEARAYDVIFDTSGSVRSGRARRALRDGGRFGTVYLNLWRVAASLFDGLRRTRVISAVALADRERMERVSALAADGVFRPVLGKTEPLERAAVAHERAAAERHHNLVICVRPELASALDSAAAC